jgi:hypothetical protein
MDEQEYLENKEFLKRAERKLAREAAKSPQNAGALKAQMAAHEAVQRLDQRKADDELHADLKRMQAEMDRKCKAAGIAERIIPFEATEYKRGGQKSTFRINGKSVTFGEFRAELSKRGINPEQFEKRIAATGKHERIITRSAVEASESQK